jgi:hypothetical protein
MYVPPLVVFNFYTTVNTQQGVKKGDGLTCHAVSRYRTCDDEECEERRQANETPSKTRSTVHFGPLFFLNGSSVLLYMTRPPPGLGTPLGQVTVFRS